MTPTLRPVAPLDCALICRHRRDMFTAAGDEVAATAAMGAEYSDWQAQTLGNGTYFGFIAELDETPVGGIGLMVLESPPHHHFPEITQRGYVLNLFVEADHRGKGIAKQLIAAADAAFRERGVSQAALTATDQARPIYEKDGWRLSPHMVKQIV